MKLHKFKFDSPEEVLAGVEARLGSSAVISRIRKVPRRGLAGLFRKRQIEVLAYSPDPSGISPVPGMSLRQVELEKPTWRKFFDQRGVNENVIEQILVAAGISGAFPQSEPELLSQIQLLRHVIHSLWPKKHIPQSDLHAFIGPSGTGKSTVLCSFIAESILMDQAFPRAFIVDFPIANPSPRLTLYSNLLGFSVDRVTPSSLRALDSGFVDSPGFALNEGLPDNLRQLLRWLPEASFHLVLNGAYDSQILQKQFQAFAHLPLAGVILTHMDEEERWGKILNLALGINCNVTHVTTGQNIPSDFVALTPELVLARLFA